MNRTELIGLSTQALVTLPTDKLGLVAAMLNRLTQPNNDGLRKKLEELLLEDTAKAPTPAPPSPTEISTEKRLQLEQSARLYETMTAEAPNEYESLEILRNAYAKLGQKEEALATWRKISQAYWNLGMTCSAIGNCNDILREFPDDPDTLSLLREATGDRPPAS